MATTKEGIDMQIKPFIRKVFEFEMYQSGRFPGVKCIQVLRSVVRASTLAKTFT